jgi:hypothetical protein
MPCCIVTETPIFNLVTFRHNMLLLLLRLLLLLLFLLHRWKCLGTPCPSGYALTPAGKCKACPAGTYNIYGNGTFPTACTPCEPGTYQPNAGAYPWLKCKPCLSPDFLIEGYRQQLFLAFTDSTTGKAVPKPGSTACNVTWCVAGIALCFV